MADGNFTCSVDNSSRNDQQQDALACVKGEFFKIVFNRYGGLGGICGGGVFDSDVKHLVLKHGLPFVGSHYRA